MSNTNPNLQSNTTRLFRIADSQAVRIPTDLAYARADQEVEIERVGDEIRIRPAPRRLTGLAAKFAAFSSDFLPNRDDPPPTP